MKSRDLLLSLSFTGASLLSLHWLWGRGCLGIKLPLDPVDLLLCAAAGFHGSTVAVGPWFDGYRGLVARENRFTKSTGNLALIPMEEPIRCGYDWDIDQRTHDRPQKP